MPRGHGPWPGRRYFLANPLLLPGPFFVFVPSWFCVTQLFVNQLLLVSIDFLVFRFFGEAPPTADMADGRYGR
jgi:hypothetical protein